jgi:hypothetical protein
MERTYGETIWALPGAPTVKNGKGVAGSDFYNTRGVVKNSRYAWQYKAGALTVWKSVVAAEDDNGRLLFPHITIEDVEEVCEGLAATDPEIPEWWSKMLYYHRKHGYIVDSFWGIRRDFKNSSNASEMVNHPIQAGGFAMVAEAIIEGITGEHQRWFSTERMFTGAIDCKLFRPNPVTGEGLITNTHDSLLLAVRASRVDEAKHLLRLIMNRKKIHNSRVLYTATSKAGKNWHET